MERGALIAGHQRELDLEQLLRFCGRCCGESALAPVAGCQVLTVEEEHDLSDGGLGEIIGREVFEELSRDCVCGDECLLTYSESVSIMQE